MHLIEVGIERVHERNVEAVLPGALRAAFFDAVVMPRAVWREHEVAGTERHALAVDHRVGAFALHHEAKRACLVAVGRGEFARVHHLHAGVEQARRGAPFLSSGIHQHDHAPRRLLRRHELGCPAHEWFDLLPFPVGGDRFRLGIPGLDLVRHVPERAQRLAFERGVVGLELRRVLDVRAADDVLALHGSSPVSTAHSLRCPMLSIPGFSDPVSSLSHLGGALVFAILGGFLIARGRGDARRVMSLVVFAASCVLLLSLSGVYHLLTPQTAARGVLLRLDHAAIFLLIAGSFTPIHAILLRERWQNYLLAGIWGAALTGLVLKTVFFEAMPSWLGLLMYLALGWLGLISTVALARRFGVRFVLPLVWGALAYTAGALADFLLWPVLLPGVIGPHEVFHAAVLAGIGFHWWFIRGIASSDRAGALDAQIAVLGFRAG